MNQMPAHFFKVRLELARETGHPGGDRETGYEFVAPLDDDGRIDTHLWQHNAAPCPARFFARGQEDRHGTLARTEGGEWFFDYDPAAAIDDEYGYRFGDERFVRGEYVSIADTAGKTHTYRVIQVEKP
ncbi:hypothetical protein [Pelagibacterium halotolerans]|uniref:hypothetical protein n=1 Tax=Pelagibacterium halotolerans TaxID=531813 RepID=UPI00384F8B9D